MANDQALGLEELMIVNPGPAGLQGLIMGTGGAWYPTGGRSEEQDVRGIGQFFLGEDGTLYQLQGIDSTGPASLAANQDSGSGDGAELGRYFLGADGALYEVVR